jgi:hypothetical protein
VQKLCSAAKGTPGGVATCMREHWNELSPGCRAQLQQRRLQQQGGAVQPGSAVQPGGAMHRSGPMRQQAAEIQGACAEDRARLCADAKPGLGGTIACLRSHETELSAGCRAALPPADPGP